MVSIVTDLEEVSDLRGAAVRMREEIRRELENRFAG